MNRTKQFDYGRMILLALEGQMDDEQFAEFDRLLREDAEFRQYYLRFMAINASLGAIDKFPTARNTDEDDAVLSHALWNQLAREEQTAETVRVETPAQKPQIVKKETIDKTPRQINRFSLASAAVSAAALLTLVLYVHFAPVHSTTLVGKLTKTVDARWQDASGHITQGCDLYSGPMHLLDGYAEITLDGGAVLVVQAPAQFTLESTQQVYLQEGQIVARKGPGDEQAFLVRTPHASLVDYGTEFGVRVTPDRQTETYVYEGQVQIRDSSNPIKFMESLLLNAGQAAAADTQSSIAPSRVDPKTFVRPAEMDVLYRAQKDDGYYRWRAMVYKLHRDPTLLAHYFFEKSQADPARMLNAVLPADIRTQAAFGAEDRTSPVWVEGRWPQKQAVRFDRYRQQVILVPPAQSLAVTWPLTIAAWVCFPNDDRWGGHLISCRRGEYINYQFSLFDDTYDYNYQKNRFEFRQYEGGESGAVGLYSSVFVPEPQRWYHVAAVFDGTEVRFYVDGRLFQAAPYRGINTPVPAEIVLGAMKKDRYILEAGDFDGLVDELMLFNRALSETQVQAIYTAGKP